MRILFIRKQQRLLYKPHKNLYDYLSFKTLFTHEVMVMIRAPRF